MNFAPPVVSLRQLQYVVAVADRLSFSGAAATCHVSQPSLSAQIALLEDALGVRVFERGTRKVLVTSAGRDVVLRARRILMETGDLVDAARRARDPLSGLYKIGVIPTISPYLLPLVAPRLRQRFPKLGIAWREEKTHVLAAALAAGEIDAALLALESELGDVDSEVVATDPFVVAAPPDHPLARSEGAVEAPELRRAEVLLLDDGHCFRDQALEVCSAARAHESELRATSLATLVQMVAGGAGITLLPSLAVPTEAARAGLSVRPLASRAAHRTIALVWRKRSPFEAAFRSIGAALREAYPERLGGAGPKRSRSGKGRGTR
jgi:LysR family hydrogen peroxide-inducible transcriptional activator